MTHITEPAKKAISTEEFLERIATKNHTLHYPELGGDIVVRSISAEDRDEISAAATDPRTKATKESVLCAVTLVKALVDPKLTPQQIDALKKSNWSLVARISNDIWKLSGSVEEVKND